MLIPNLFIIWSFTDCWKTGWKFSLKKLFTLFWNISSTWSSYFSEEGGLRSLNENYRTQYDASEGRPRFDYETIFPQAYYDLSDMAEVPLDIASTAGIIKYGPKLLNISAKQFRKQPDSFNKAIEEYLRD